MNPKSNIQHPKSSEGLRAQKMKDKRQRILRAATELFATEGFHYTHTGEIAKRADIATGTLYLYFRGKDVVLLAIVQEAMAGFVDRVRGILDGPDAPDEKFRQVIACNLGELEHQPALAHIILLEVRQSSHEVKKKAFEALEGYLALLRRLIAEGCASRHFCSVDPELAAGMILGAIEQIALRWLRGPRDGSLATRAASFASVFLEGLQRSDANASGKNRAQGV